MLFICYPKCTTCKKAAQWLDRNGIDYHMRDIKLENPMARELRDWHRRSGVRLSRFFNTSGVLYRELGLKSRLKELGEDEQLELLASDGMLVRRPLLIGEDFALAGFSEEFWRERLLGRK